MKVSVISEHGYEEAVLGFSLSYNTSLERTRLILPKYAFGIPGENKFLESMVIWTDVTAPRYWWQEADTYRVGTSKQSESTMHTITKTLLSPDHFEFDNLPFQLDDYLYELNTYIGYYKEEKDPILKRSWFYQIKQMLPESFLQRRIWMFSYKTLQNMFVQRIKHRLPQWQTFLTTVLAEIEHPEFIIKEQQSA